MLDIGCGLGWGNALKYAAENYGVAGADITISQEQADYARQLCAGLPVERRLQDYREINERFRRMGRYYLAVSAAVFRSRRDPLWQLTLSAHGVAGGYRVPR